MERKERIKYKQKYQEALKKLDDIKNLDKSNPIDLTRIIESAASRAYRIESNIELLRTGFNNAESITNPLYFPLQKVYNEIIMDSHVTSCIQIRKNYVLSREFSLLNKAGIVDEKSEAFFDKRWLTDFMNMVLDSIWYGYSLIKIGDIVDDSIVVAKGNIRGQQDLMPDINDILTDYQLNVSSLCLGMARYCDNKR